MSEALAVGVLAAIGAVLTAGVMYEFGLLYSVWKGAPYVSTTRRTAEAMLDLADVRQGSLVVDLGSGDGEICLAAARRGATALGIEVNPWLIWASRVRAWRMGVHRHARFELADIWGHRLPPDTDVVCLYLLPGMYARVWEKLRKELRPGTKVVSHAFRFPDVEPLEEREGVRLYVI